MIDIEAFRLRYPEFSDSCHTPDHRINLFIDDSRLEMGNDEKRWLGYYNLAMANLVAHKLVRAEASGAGGYASKVGPVTSKSAGGVSVTRSPGVSLGSGAEYYGDTLYGVEFLRIRNLCFLGVLSV